MSRIINKALFYKEWINVKWVTMVTIITLLFYKGYGVITLLNQNNEMIRRLGKIPSNRWFNNGLHMQDDYFFIMILIVIILSIVLFIVDKSSGNQGFIAAMPFTRKEIILNKWMAGVISLLISFVVTYVFLSLFYVLNISGMYRALNPYSDIVRWVLMNMAQSICIFTFMVLAQTVMGNSVVSGIVAGIMLIVPYFITWSIQNVLLRYFGFVQSIRIRLDSIRYWLNVYQYNLAYTSNVNINDNYNPYYYTNYKLKLLVLFILTCLFLYLAYISFKKKDLEYNLKLFVFKNLEPVFMCVFAICTGFLVGLIFGEYSLMAFWVYVITFIIVGYFVAKQLVKVLSSRK